MTIPPHPRAPPAMHRSAAETSCSCLVSPVIKLVHRAYIIREQITNNDLQPTFDGRPTKRWFCTFLTISTGRYRMELDPRVSGCSCLDTTFVETTSSPAAVWRPNPMKTKRNYNFYLFLTSCVHHCCAFGAKARQQQSRTGTGSAPRLFIFIFRTVLNQATAICRWFVIFAPVFPILRTPGRFFVVVLFGGAEPLRD